MYICCQKCSYDIMENNMKELKSTPIHLKRPMLIIGILDVVFLIIMYFLPPSHQDGLTTLIFSLLIGFVNIVISIVLFFLKRERWSIAFFLNSFLIFFAINCAACQSSCIHWKSEHIDYAFEVNDSSFTLTINKNDSAFDMCYEGHHYTQGYCCGVYRKAPSDVYILNVDTTRSWAKSMNRFVIKNGYIEGYGKRKLVLKSRIREKMMW